VEVISHAVEGVNNRVSAGRGGRYSIANAHSSITHNLLHRASSLDSQSPLPPSGSVTADKASISVTIDAGIKEERQCWMAAKGSLDTQGAGVWITRDLISRAGLLHKIRPLEQKAGPFIDFAGKETWATHCIKLIWFPNQSSKTHETTFLVSESGPFDVLFGRDYMDRLNGPSPILALVPGHKKKSKSDAESIIWKHILIPLRRQEET